MTKFSRRIMFYFYCGTYGLLLGCQAGPPSTLNGDPEKGKLLLRQFGCVSCHYIPGVAGGTNNVGPPLSSVGRRVYLAGVVPNSPENMMSWIRHPQRYEPRTAMPNMQVSEAQARDMVAYLQSLK